jgi:hypothetical protein
MTRCPTHGAGGPLDFNVKSLVFGYDKDLRIVTATESGLCFLGCDETDNPDNPPHWFEMIEVVGHVSVRGNPRG